MDVASLVWALVTHHKTLKYLKTERERERGGVVVTRYISERGSQKQQVVSKRALQL
jgi:hypothetical protein